MNIQVKWLNIYTPSYSMFFILFYRYSDSSSQCLFHTQVSIICRNDSVNTSLLVYVKQACAESLRMYFPSNYLSNATCILLFISFIKLYKELSIMYWFKGSPIYCFMPFCHPVCHLRRIISFRLENNSVLLQLYLWT